MEIPPDTLEDFLTKAARVSAESLVYVNVFPVFFDLSTSQGDIFFGENLFFSRIRDQYRSIVDVWYTLTSELMLGECVFVGLGDRVQHSSFCDFCILVIC